MIKAASDILEDEGRFVSARATAVVFYRVVLYLS
jgi:hypothetical protein